MPPHGSRLPWGPRVSARRQNNQLELAFGEGVTGEARSAAPEGTEADTAAPRLESPAVLGPLMEAIVERDNLRRALAQVRRNRGAPGVDGMTVDDLPPYLKDHWPSIRSQLLDGTYRPQPVLRVEIPKVGGGVRALGIPTVLDRFIQQAVLQVLQAVWDPTFSEASYGFRPRRSAHQAVARAQEHIADGHGWVVDLDLEKFFDRMNHDILMGLPPGPAGPVPFRGRIEGLLAFDGQAGCRPAHPKAHPRVSCRRCDGGWVGRADGRGDPRLAGPWGPRSPTGKAAHFRPCCRT